MPHLVRKPATTAGDGLQMSLLLGGSQGQNSQTTLPPQSLDFREHETASHRLAREALGQRGCMAHALASLATHYARRAVAVAVAR